MPGNDTKASKVNSKLKRLHVIQVQGHLEAVRWSRRSWVVKMDDGGKSGRLKVTILFRRRFTQAFAASGIKLFA